MNEQELQKIATETVDEFIKTLGIEGKAEISLSDEAVTVVFTTEDTGVIIGYHGEVLEALQLLLSIAITKKAGKFIRVSVDAGEYKKNRITWLEQLATQTKEKALEQQREIELSNLKSWERRVIHLFLQEDKEVVCESFGEGKDRILVVQPR